METTEAISKVTGLQARFHLGSGINGNLQKFVQRNTILILNARFHLGSGINGN